VNPSKPRVVVWIESGIVTMVQSDIAYLEVVVMDQDVENLTPDDPRYVVSKIGEIACRSFPDVFTFATDTGWTEDEIFSEEP
jgi:hypothetical protein